MADREVVQEGSRPIGLVGQTGQRDAIEDKGLSERLSNRSASGDAKSAEIVLIPKQLRMEWTDTMVLDPNLSHVAVRVGCVIGTHFNRRSGETYVRQDTIARIMGISARTVWSAIVELERSGYLIVKRRELGFREKDGRRVCGGRGVANTYAPAFERSQLAATTNGTKLAARCDQLWNERSQKSVNKVATGCEPTLASPSEKNPWPPQADDAGNSAAWSKVSSKLRDRIGNSSFEAYFRETIFESGPPATFLVRSQVLVELIEKKFSKDLDAIFCRRGWIVRNSLPR
jgi:hypothetical protein